MSVYLDNVLNKYETYTYNWALHITHPANIDLKLEQLKSQSKIVTLAQSGVENEISIESVEQNFVLTFVNTNRQSIANQFNVNFIEVGGITFFSRIIKAANDLGLENHLKAVYIFELNFSGSSPDGIPTRNIRDAGPFYYYCVFRSLTMSFQNGAAYYSGDLVEVTEEAFKENEFTLISDVTVYAKTFGEFLTNFQNELNRQARSVAATNPNILWPNSYVLKDAYGASDWGIGSIDPGILEGARVVSVSPTSGAQFSLPIGTTITSAISAALMATNNFRRMPIGLTGERFAKSDPNQTIANPEAFADQIRWFSFRTSIKYGNYDRLSNNYAKQLTYTVIPILAPQAINDPDSYQQVNSSPRIQRDKINKMFSNGQIKKRYDYIFTGKNTEVLNFDIALNNTYFTMQTTLNGAKTFASGEFSGGSSDNGTPSVLKGRLNDVLTRLYAAKSSLSNIDRLIKGNGPGNRTQLQAERVRLQSEIGSLVRQEAALTDSLEQFQTSANFISTVPTMPDSKRYITQSELYANSDINSNNGLTIPMSFLYHQPQNPGTQGGEPNGQEVGAAQAAAMYNNLYSVADLVQITLTVRGDPYWLGRPNNQTGANYQQGGQGFFLNIRAPRYPNDNTGLMDIENQVSYFLSGLYLMYQGSATYQGGSFTMNLVAYRDMNCQTPLIYEQLDRGQIYRDRDGVSSLPGLTSSEDESVTGASGTPQLPPEGSLPSGATGASPSGGHSLASGVNPALNNILTLTGNQTGVTVVTTSGYRAGPGSGRHLGDASDIALYSGGRRLSVSNAADRAIIQTFSQNFINNARAQGYTPSVGWANHTYPSSQWYMGGNTGHYDIAVGNSIDADRSTVWGGSGATAHVRPPNWLTSLF
jgi:hypothetical protein